MVPMDWLLTVPSDEANALADFAPSRARRGFGTWTTTVAIARRAGREDGTRERTHARAPEPGAPKPGARAIPSGCSGSKYFNSAVPEAPSLNHAQEAQGRG